MTGPLKNARHEAFARALFEGQTADEAYVTAGYSENRGNAARLKAKESILIRVAEFQSAAAKASQVSIESLLAELETARERANNAEQYSANVRASEAKAKVSGVMVQRIEVTNIDQDFDNAETMEDVAKALAKGITGDKGLKLTAEQLAGFTKLVTNSIDALDHYLAGCQAKIVKPATDLQTIQRHERRRLGLTNGGG